MTQPTEHPGSRLDQARSFAVNGASSVIRGVGGATVSAARAVAGAPSCVAYLVYRGRQIMPGLQDLVDTNRGNPIAWPTSEAEDSSSEETIEATTDLD